MTRLEAQRALRVLRALYVIVREPHHDAIADAVAQFGGRLREALAARDNRAARAILDELGEWLLRMRHVVTARLESSFRADSPTLPTGRPLPKRNPRW